jgi:ribosomal-protein-alanine acetyltransferase
MTAADLDAVLQIEQAVAYAQWDRKLFMHCIQADYQAWVMVQNLQVVGYGVLKYDALGGYLLNLAIAAQFQSQGLGHKMLQHLIATAKADYMPGIRLYVRDSNLVAINLYKKYNFKPQAELPGYYPARLGHPAETAQMLAVHFNGDE